jgi:hypothetical protein
MYKYCCYGVRLLINNNINNNNWNYYLINNNKTNTFSICKKAFRGWLLFVFWSLYPISPQPHVKHPSPRSPFHFSTTPWDPPGCLPWKAELDLFTDLLPLFNELIDSIKDHIIICITLQNTPPVPSARYESLKWTYWTSTVDNTEQIVDNATYRIVFKFHIYLNHRQKKRSSSSGT